MDTSQLKEYVKQCEKAEEIQAIWRKAGGLMNDAVYIPPKPQPIEDWMEEAWADWMPCYTESDYNFQALNATLDSIWLPRQEELQAMVEERPSPKLFASFLCFLGWDGTSFSKHQYPQLTMSNCEFTLMRQLWLAFVMQQNYGKHWIGEEWKLTQTQ